MHVRLRTIAWITCIFYSTIPAFWLLIHPRSDYWRSRRTSPYKTILPIWFGMWVVVAAVTAPWRNVLLYKHSWIWFPAIALFCVGLLLYKLSRHQFTLAQFAGLSEIQPRHHQQRLATTGIRAHIRHPIYLAHLCGMLAWSVGTGLAACWVLTAFAVITGAIMIRMEDKELELRFGEPYRLYRATVPAFIPFFSHKRKL